jgi:hypothetical protein
MIEGRSLRSYSAGKLAMLKRLDELRDKLLTEARYGKITPQQAEAQAKAAGLPPFETQPDLAAFDPMAESRNIPAG